MDQPASDEAEQPPAVPAATADTAPDGPPETAPETAPENNDVPGTPGVPDGGDGEAGAGDGDGDGDEEGERADAPRPLGITVRPTGHRGVDARLARLAAADDLAVPAHLEVYEDVHRGLRETLTALDEPQQPGPPGPGGPGRHPHDSRS
ncbi:hypothetical protein [Streptomyces aidingensis]|uniref:Uncharacterized protein n=1 Tax=Streptomyces aidingensis TaxID=910347 RepID=A0A1I1UGD2_9ACTN|nr:hypothetical protein [Streptomyces aidingensis]SFD67823.1 hypothetical protein SAMN05421773_12371 [Streptomyces aidingensis]